MKKHPFLIISILIAVSIMGFYIFHHFNSLSESKPLNYLKSIEKVYNSNISGMAVVYCKTSKNMWGLKGV